MSSNLVAPSLYWPTCPLIWISLHGKATVKKAYTGY